MSDYTRKLSGDQAAEIKYLLKNTNYTSLKEIGDRYGVTAVLIGKIRDEKLWKRIFPVKPDWYE
jgi:hypothetical protein